MYIREHVTPIGNLYELYRQETFANNFHTFESFKECLYREHYLLKKKSNSDNLKWWLGIVEIKACIYRVKELKGLHFGSCILNHNLKQLNSKMTNSSRQLICKFCTIFLI
jgi:hypothetical protein